ncbi:DUF1294 domain-containing protein [Enterococcus sp. LJL99]
MSQLIWMLSLIYLLIVNALEVFLMYYDKRQARRRKNRIPERTLIVLGVLGGGIGGLISQQLFNHKTKKIRFYFCYLVGTFVAVVLIYFCHGK